MSRYRTLWLGLLFAMLGFGLGLGATRACPADGPACEVALGEYRAMAPAGRAGPRPAVVFIHGYGGSASDILARKDITAAFAPHGYVVIAPQGLIRPEAGRRSWSFRPGDPPRRDELAFIRQIMADATPRFQLDRARVLLAGESIGGSLTWYLACLAPGEFAAYAPVNGGFWNPLPGRCAGPVKLLHTHGWTDDTVPLEGRIIRNFAVQGDIFAGLAIWRTANGCTAQAPTMTSAEGPIWHRQWAGCAPGSSLEFVLHPGGHEVRDWWAPIARAWFERAVPR